MRRFAVFYFSVCVFTLGCGTEPIGNVAVQLSGGTYIFFANRTPSTSSRFDKKELTYMFQTMPICQLKNGH